MYLGHVTLEGTLAFAIVTPNTSDVPTNADATPTYAIYNAAGTSLATGTLAGALGAETGVYRFSASIAAASGFAAGSNYIILISYDLSTADRRQTYTFAVV